LKTGHPDTNTLLHEPTDTHED